MKDEGRELLEAISHERTVGDVLASGAIGERALYGLVAAGWAECLEEIVPFDGDDEVVPAARASGELARSADAPAPPPSAPTAAPVKSEAERALEAERWFRDGKAFLATKRFQQAAEAFGMASHLDPGEGEYAAHLGYSLYLTNPKDTLLERESLEHIARGIKQSPSRELSYVFLGRIFKAKGDVEMAAKVFRRALKIRHDCHPARKELRQGGWGLGHPPLHSHHPPSDPRDSIRRHPAAKHLDVHQIRHGLADGRGSRGWPFHPDVPVYAYMRTLTYYQGGLGAALAIIMFAILIVCTVFYFRLFREEADIG